MAMVKARLKDDGRVVKVTASGRERSVKSSIDSAKVDAMTEAEAQQDAAAYARGIRERFGVSQEVFAERLGASPETVRSSELGRRSLKGPAKALLRFMDREPAAASRFPRRLILPEPPGYLKLLNLFIIESSASQAS